MLFVHGFNGDATTWRNGNADWPTLLVGDPQIGSDVDVFELNYFSTITQGSSVHTLAARMAEELDKKFFGYAEDQRPPVAYNKIVLICHSLGGLLCRNYLLHVKLRWGHQFLSLMRATITFGIPLTGASLANFTVARASSNEQLRVLRLEDGNDFLQLLNESIDEFEQKRAFLGCPRMVFSEKCE